MTLHAERTIVGVKKIMPETRALTGGTVAASAITSITNGTMVADEFNNGYMVILNGSQAGQIYRIIDNGTHNISVDRPTLTDATLGPVNNGNRVALFPMRRHSEETISWILCDSVSGLTPTKEYDEYFAATRDGEPYRTGAKLMRTKMGGTLEFTPQNGNMFPLIFPYTTDTGTATGGGLATALNGATQPGEDRITVDAVTNGTVGNYIRVGGSATGEIRAISAINGTTKIITLDTPLRRGHADNGTVTQMNTALPFTHTFKTIYDSIYRIWPFELILVHRPSSGDHVIQYHKYQVNGYTFKNDGNKFTVSLDLIGYYYDYENGTSVTAPTAINGSILTYYYSEVSVNSTVDGKVRTVNVNGNYGGEEGYYHTSANDTYPFEIRFRRMENQTVTLGVRVEDDKFLKLLDDGTEFDAYAKYNWNGTDYLRINVNNAQATVLPFDIPPGGPIDVDLQMTQQYIEVVIVDDEPYW